MTSLTRQRMKKARKKNKQISWTPDGTTVMDDEALQTMRAIKEGAVDAFVVSTPEGDKVYTLEGAEHPYRIFFEAMNEGAVTLTSDGVIVYANTVFSKMVRQPLEEIVDIPFRKFIAPRDLEAYEELLREGFKESAKKELYLITGGKKLPVLISSHAMTLRKTSGLCLVVTNLRQQKFYEQRVASERLTQRILNQVGEAILVCDTDGTIIRASNPAQEMFATNPVHKNFSEFVFHTTGAPSERFSITPVLKGRDIKNEEVIYEQKTGTARYLLLNASPLRGSQKHIYGCVISFTDITERKINADILRENEARLELASHAGRMFAFEWNVTTDEVMRSEIAGEILGLTDKATRDSREHFFSMIHPDDLYKLEAALTRLRLGDNAYSLTYRIIRPDTKTIVALEEKGRGYFDGDGNIERVIGMTADITKRKEIEGNLEYQRELSRKIIDTIPVMIVLYDSELKTFSINQETKEKLGWSEEDAADSTFMEKAYPDPDYRQIVKEFMQSPRPEWHDFIVTAKDGSSVESSWTNIRLSDETVIGVGIDKNEQRKMERALYESEMRFRRLKQSGIIGIIEGEGDEIKEANDAFLTMLGITRDTLRAGTINWRYLTPPEYTDLVEKAIQQLKERGVSEPYEKEFIHKDGSRIPVFIGAALVSRKPFQWISFVLDISDQKEAEKILRRDKSTLEEIVRVRSQELVKIRADLERSKRLSDIGQLAATIAHELRNPLAAISTATFNINKKMQDNRIKRNIDTINKKIYESDQIINNLLFYSKIKKVHYEKIMPHAILKEVIDQSCKRLKQKITIKKSIDSIKDLATFADPTQIKELFTNVLNNAIDALDKTDGEIDILAESDGKNVSISIRDNGSGIEEQHLKRVCDPFFTTKTKGTGLGLAVCRWIAELHDGSIDIQSTRGKGTEVYITLPLKKSTDDQAIQQAEQR